MYICSLYTISHVCIICQLNVAYSVYYVRMYCVMMLQTYSEYVESDLDVVDVHSLL